MLMRGAFIVFEGADRCGKTTQANLLAERLRGRGGDRDVECIRFPDRDTAIGRVIDAHLASSAETETETETENDSASAAAAASVHLLFSANRWERARDIERKLRAGTTLLCDRYAYSGAAYASAKGLDMDWCQACDRGLPAPDGVLFFDLPAEDAATRGDFGAERYERVEFQNKVRGQFAKLRAEEEREHVRAAGGTAWHVLDARKDIHALHEDVCAIVEKIVAGRQIKRLWL